MRKIYKPLIIACVLIAVPFMLHNHYKNPLVYATKQEIVPLPTATPTPTPIPIVKIKHPRLGLLNVGHAVYGLTSDSFDCDNFFRSMKKIPEWHISFLYNTFGNNFECLKRIMNNPHTRTIQVHLINEASHRAGKNQWYEFTYSYSLQEYNRLWEQNDPKLLKKFSKYVQPLQQLFDEYIINKPWIQCIIGPGLESNVYQTAAENQVDAARIEFPYCKISWNGMKSIAWNADLIEKHSANPNISPPCIVDLDGEDIDFPERRSEALNDGNEWTNAVNVNNLKKYIETLANRCDLYYLWAWESNCSTSGATRDPNQRNRNCSDPQVNLVLKLIADEIKWANKYALVNPEVYNWSYDESLPLNLCSSVKKEPKTVFIDSTQKGLIKLDSRYNVQTAYVMYKNKVIDVYSLREDSGKTQIWTSKLNPKKRYPYKTVLVTTVLKEDQTVKTICWKINNPLGK